MKPTALLSLLLALAVLAMAAAAQDSPRAPATEYDAGAAPAAQAAAPTPASNLVVTVDPGTGRLRPASAGEIEDLLDEDLQKALSTSVEDLVAVESPLPGGGVMIDLQGRFQSVQVATIDADGKLQVEVHCLAGDHGLTGDHPSAEADGVDSETENAER